MARATNIEGLTLLQIQQKFALPQIPTHYCFVNVPGNTTLFVGIVN